MTITVSELRRLLEAYPDGMEVHIGYAYGDHWHTTVAPKATSVMASFVRHSDYHNMDVVTHEDNEGIAALVLS